MSAAEPAAELLERVARVAAAAREAELDALLLTGAVAVRYATAFTGSSGVALIGGDGGASEPSRHRFITDFRYATQASEEVPEEFARDVVADNLLEGVAQALGTAGGRLGFLEKNLTVAEHTRLRELIAAQWELVPSGELLERLRMVKDAGEIAAIRAAAELADDAMRTVLDRGLAGRSERAVALELEEEMRRRGADGPSFPTIVAAGAHAALPHAKPREREIPRDVLVTIDWGALHEGYCSDCTRTYATGEAIDERAREVYEVVRAAQARAVEAVRPGASTLALDGVARSHIEAAGYGERFGHGLGHGVGLEVHEGPRLSRTAPDQPLRSGNVVTVEPGVYLPDELGVRIEDLLVVTEPGHEVLSALPRELTVIS
ncbi:MAG TPA: aminopeptidase P family protein [Solirubrobacteraceae bacterium]|nr:aminopeptidase P family protein [Solirubrobacteraceae bacterium]